MNKSIVVLLNFNTNELSIDHAHFIDTYTIIFYGMIPLFTMSGTASYFLYALSGFFGFNRKMKFE